MAPGRSLLLPMLILAAGIHVALLALPLPSTEATKEAEDQKNPITVNQIPTEQPEPAVSPTTGKVNVPDLAIDPSGDDAASASNSPAAAAGDATVDSDTADTKASSSEPNSDATASSATTSTATNSSSPVSTAANATTSSEAATDSENGSTSELDADSEAASSSPAAAPSTGDSAANPFADFPHFQPSEADCYGLGFGENCRIVASQDLTQVAEFFTKELAAKEFTTTVVTDTADRKVFKVEKGDQTLFLNIWKGKNTISYLLSKVILKQPPEAIQVEAKQ